MKRKNISMLVSFIVMVLFLGSAYAIDIWLTELKAAPFGNSPFLVLWVSFIGRLLIALGFMGLFWYMLTNRHAGRFLPAVFIILGILILSSPILYLTASRFVPIILPTSMLYTAGALSAACGILVLLIPEK